MLETLDRIIKERLPTLMQPASQHLWNSVHVTYHAPRVERLWTQIDEQHRLFLHRIYPCEKGEALYHPHPWPSAVRIVSGQYEMGISSKYFPDEDDEEDEPAWTSQHATVILGPGSSYEMTDRNGWHYVRPIESPADTIMLVGPLYDPSVEMPQPPTEKQAPLPPERFEELFEEWRGRKDWPLGMKVVNNFSEQAQAVEPDLVELTEWHTRMSVATEILRGLHSPLLWATRNRYRIQRPKTLRDLGNRLSDLTHDVVCIQDELGDLVNAEIDRIYSENDHEES